MQRNTAITQTVTLGCVFFAIPGLWNSISSMAGGIGSGETYSTATAALYGTYAIVAFLAPVVVNVAGARPTLWLGSLGYIMFVVALWKYSILGSTFLIASGAATGLSAGLLWTAQGALIMAYPTPDQKGFYLSVFWVIFNLGGVMGGAIAFATNYGSEAGAADSKTYIAYLIVMCLGSVTILTLLLPPERVIRPDGEYVKVAKLTDTNVCTEFICILRLFSDKRLLLLSPLFIYSNWFYTYQFTVFNAQLFNARTQGLNNMIYWGSQMAAAVAIGKLLDGRKGLSVRRRAICSFPIVVLASIIGWAGAVAVARTEDLGNTAKWAVDANKKDFCSGGNYVGLLVLYLIWGGADALTQVLAYWILGQLDDSPAVLSRFAGFYKSLQSAGAAVAWSLGGSGTPAGVQLWINIALFLVSVVTTAAAIHLFLVEDDSRDELDVTKRKNHEGEWLLGSVEEECENRKEINV